MTEHANIYAALAAAQVEMSAPVKGSVNPAFRSKYADLADVVRAVAPALSAHGIAFYHFTQHFDATNQIFMTTALVHGASDTRLECAIPLIVSKQDMHGFKSATTYAKRIGLESVTGVAPEDDDGNAAAKNPPARSRTVIREIEAAPDNGDAPPLGDRFYREPEPRNPAQAASDGLRDAWIDAIKDQLPFDATNMSALHPAQKLQYWAAVADALVDAFARLKSAKGVSAQWDKRADLIEEMSTAAPNAFAKVQDAFDQRMRDFEPPFILGEQRVPG